VKGADKVSVADKNFALSGDDKFVIDRVSAGIIAKAPRHRSFLWRRRTCRLTCRRFWTTALAWSRRRGVHPLEWRAWREMGTMPVSRQELIEALERTARGDVAAFKMVYAATSVKLYGIIIRILDRPDVADEVLQEVYVRVWQRADVFDPASSSPITWLATIARNRALDEARRNTMRSIEEVPEVLQLPSEDDVSASHERNEQLRRLYACLDGLEPERKEIVLLAYYHGMTREEIASRLGRPVATVKTWLRRSLAQLKGCLGQ
jgi:RNA polymerase sigma-70 factor (ECF subfamily)